MNSDAAKHGGTVGVELEKRVMAVVTAERFERELGAVSREISALRDEMHVGLAEVHHEMQAGFRLR